MSGAKARFYGLPEVVVDAALAEGAHPDCLVAKPQNTTQACLECRNIVVAAIHIHYHRYGGVPEQMMRLADDVKREQAGD
jgi:hypothetical protein